MPRFNNRFARQNCYEPPPEFPLASPYPGIVHHLSGPNVHAHTQTFLPKDLGRQIVPPKGPTNVTFILHWVCHPSTRMHVRLLGPCFKTGQREALRPSHCRSTDLGKSKKEIHSQTLTRSFLLKKILFKDKPTGNCYQRKHHSGDLSGHYPGVTLYFPSRDPQRFQVLFNSLFKVLCIFPSRYLCTIGFQRIFSLRRNLPPDSSCNPKQLNSLEAHLRAPAHRIVNGSFTLSAALFQGTLSETGTKYVLIDHNSAHSQKRYAD